MELMTKIQHLEKELNALKEAPPAAKQQPSKSEPKRSRPRSSKNGYTIPYEKSGVC